VSEEEFAGDSKWVKPMNHLIYDLDDAESVTGRPSALSCCRARC